MWKSTREVLTSAFQDFVRCSKILVAADLAYKLIAFALLTPGTVLLLGWLRSRASARVVADADILRFFVTTRIGVLTLLVGGSLIAAITALETACLMAIGLAAARGAPPTGRSALAFAATRAANVLRLAAHMVARVLVGLLPFLAAVGLVYWGLLRKHDINYYLARHPPEFWTAILLAALVVLGLVCLLVRTIGRWALALPLVLFENVHPRRALGESARRSAGSRSVIVLALACWALLALALPVVAHRLLDFLGRGLAPQFAGSLPLLLVFVAALALLWGGIGLAIAIVNVSLFSLIITRLYLRIGEPRVLAEPARGGVVWRLSGRAAAGVAIVVLLAATGLTLFAFQRVRDRRPVLVIAHRGSSATAPENTLAAFRLAAEQGANYVEFDVQESSDGEIVVMHDSDLMKVGGAAMKVFDTAADLLRTIDIGSRAGPQYAAERVPTFAEALAVLKGRTHVVVELKSYGHNQRLEERVAAIVEAAGMEQDCIFMSLDHGMMRTLKRLRPAWRCGLLVAKAVGNATELDADFLAVEARMATNSFVRRAHRAGKDVYVWTLNDPAWMLAAMGRGVDGLITDNPDLALKVVARRAQMSDAQRVLLALLVRLGARTEALQAEDALRP